ncbi:hypothetical protein [Candidatus Poriferisodalis sp.]|uniref:hypothetical protein n=1 Tax=Candidatus Poriferisodalis sp. TaxID=3101277 RepID=UPI003B5B55C5
MDDGGLTEAVAWIRPFDIDRALGVSSNPSAIDMVIGKDTPTLLRYAFDVAPAQDAT